MGAEGESDRHIWKGGISAHPQFYGGFVEVVRSSL